MARRIVPLLVSLFALFTIVFGFTGCSSNTEPDHKDEKPEQQAARKEKKGD